MHRNSKGNDGPSRSEDASSEIWFGMSLSDLVSHLRLLANDLEQGSPSVCQNVVAVEQWALARRAVPCLIGFSQGHPKVANGAPLFSSELFFLDADRGLARTFSRWYSLGERVEPDFWNSRTARQ
ncbi:Hypothetical protein NGAL_HAMBI1146_31980 [Neorhizobium galegae bv. officinalis]|nr:Hypothetical protein NGAL_HAMBI1146_31980 [Neorhizobium galegae bv. officinalis]